MDAVVLLMLLAIVALVALLAFVNRNRKAPGDDAANDDYHILHSEYQSGMGGGEARSWKIPKDPQAYARLYIPKDRKK